MRAEQQRALVHGVQREAYAYAPFWRDRLDQAGVSPASVRSLGDLARLPLGDARPLQAKVAAVRG